MKKLLLVFVMVMVSGCSRPDSGGEALLKVNDYTMSVEEYVREVNELSDFERAGKTDSELLEGIVEKKLMLQEAQRLGLDKEKPFMKMIERYWEQSLLRRIIERKMAEFSGDDRNQKVRREETKKAFKEWIASLKGRAEIVIDKDLLNTAEKEMEK